MSDRGWRMLIFAGAVLGLATFLIDIKSHNWFSVIITSLCVFDVGCNLWKYGRVENERSTDITR
jgi:hypothetical protein